jgi:hypothetical protein
MCNFLAGLSNLPNSSQSVGGIPQDKNKNVACEDESNWLHRNNAYQMQQIAGRMRAVAMPLDHNKPQAMQHNVGPLTQQSGVKIPQLSRTVNLPTPDWTTENAG